jgi:hypothetical protein
MALTTVKNSGLTGSIDLTSKVTGSLPVANGGTGLAAGTTDQYLKFTGTTTLASAAVASDLVLIQSQTTTSASSLSFTTSFDGTYDTHMFVVNNLDPSNDGTQFYFRVLTGSGGSTELTSDYVYSVTGLGANGSSYANESTSASQVTLMQDVDNYATYKSGLTLWLGKPDETALKRFWWLGGGERDGAGSNVCWQGSGCCANSSDAITGVKFYPAAGTFTTVTINHYGLKGS